MTTIVVTGAICSGKTLFCKLLGQRIKRLKYVSADNIVREIYETDSDTLASAEEILRFNFFDKNGVLQSDGIRSIIFSDSKKRVKLEKLIHPKVYEKIAEIKKSAEKRGFLWLLAEIPLYFESEARFDPDCIISVESSKSVRETRFLKRDVADDTLWENIISSQLSSVERISLSDHCVWNNSTKLDLFFQGEKILRLYQHMAIF